MPNAGKFFSFTWRAMLYPCVYEAVFIFFTPDANPYSFVGSHTPRVCKNAVMQSKIVGREVCNPECYK